MGREVLKQTPNHAYQTAVAQQTEELAELLALSIPYLRALRSKYEDRLLDIFEAWGCPPDFSLASELDRVTMQECHDNSVKNCNWLRQTLVDIAKCKLSRSLNLFARYLLEGSALRGEYNLVSQLPLALHDAMMLRKSLKGRQPRRHGTKKELRAITVRSKRVAAIASKTSESLRRRA